jgi:aminoglycoside phosphotransferase (APT) family kinase protein
MADAASQVLWEKVDLFNIQPKWTSEPSVDAIKIVVQRALLTETQPEVMFLAQGGFNKLYTIRLADDHPDYVMRVALPVDPYFKTESEAATLKLLAEKTRPPVPNVIAYSSSHDNELGFEWILMQHMPGETLPKQLKTMTWEMKEELVKEIVRHIAELKRQNFSGIGNLFLEGQPAKHINTRSASPSEYEIRCVVTMDFFWRARLKQGVPRGPFARSADWLATLLQLVINESEDRLRVLHTRKAAKEESRVPKATPGVGDGANSGLIVSSEDNSELTLSSDPTAGISNSDIESLTLQENGQTQSNESEVANDEYIDVDASKSDDEDDEEDIQRTLDLALRLRDAIPIFFPPSEDTSHPEQTTLFHNDLNWSNMLAGSNGKLTAILDWECVPAVPSWKACQLPMFLTGRPRDEPLTPRETEIMPEGLSEEDAKQWVEEQGWQDQYHEEAAQEYDQTRLREVFKAEMRRVDPEWMRVYEAEASVKKRDFDAAVLHCDEDLNQRRIEMWLERVSSGHPYRRLWEIFEGETWGD